MIDSASDINYQLPACLRSLKRAEAKKHAIKILVVEDTPVIQAVVKLFLKQLGHEADIAETGTAALKLYNSNCYDLVFMDIDLPDTDGITVTAKIRSIEKKHIPIIAMTSHTEADVKENCRKAGMDGYFGKPTSTADLQAIISQHLTADNQG